MMIKSGQAFEQAVVDVIDPATKCEKCGEKLDIMSSTNGIVKCDKCGFENPIKEMN